MSTMVLDKATGAVIAELPMELCARPHDVIDVDGVPRVVAKVARPGSRSDLDIYVVPESEVARG
jgi:hypothetical protein